MAKQVINIGTAVNAKDGDTVRDAFNKVNQNFDELYAATGIDDYDPSRLVNGTHTVSLGADGVLTMPDGLTIDNSIIGYNSSNTITQDENSQTITVESQIEITSNNIVIVKKVTEISSDGVTTSTDSAGSSIEVNNSGAFIKQYAEPDGPDNSSYFQVRTNNGAILEGVNELVGGSTFGRVTATQGAVVISASVGGNDKEWLFDNTGDIYLPVGGDIKTPEGVSVLGTPTVLDGGNASTVF